MLINRFDEAIAQMTPQQINVLVGRLEQKMGLVRGLYRVDQVIAHAKKYWDNPSDNDEYQEDAVIGNKVRYTRNGKIYYRALPGKGKKNKPKGRRVKAAYSHPEEERQAKALGKLALIAGGAAVAAVGGAAAASYLYENRPWQESQNQGNNPSPSNDPSSDRTTPPDIPIETLPPSSPSNPEPPVTEEKPKSKKKPKPKAKAEDPPIEPPVEEAPEPPKPTPIDIEPIDIEDEPDPINIEPMPQREPSPTLKGWQALGIENQGAYSKTSPDGYAVHLMQNQDKTWLSSDTGFKTYNEHQTLGEAVEHGDRLLAKHQAQMGLPEQQQENLSNSDKEKDVEAIAEQRQQEEAGGKTRVINPVSGEEMKNIIRDIEENMILPLPTAERVPWRREKQTGTYIKKTTDNYEVYVRPYEGKDKGYPRSKYKWYVETEQHDYSDMNNGSPAIFKTLKESKAFADDWMDHWEHTQREIRIGEEKSRLLMQADAMPQDWTYNEGDQLYQRSLSNLRRLYLSLHKGLEGYQWIVQLQDIPEYTESFLSFYDAKQRALKLAEEQEKKFKELKTDSLYKAIATLNKF